MAWQHRNHTKLPCNKAADTDIEGTVICAAAFISWQCGGQDQLSLGDRQENDLSLKKNKQVIIGCS